MLGRIGFPDRLRELITFGLRESNISVLWNKEKLDPFRTGRRLRQGDPLTPYLFILAMETLSWDIQEEVRKGNWKPFKLARGGTGVSHVFFADDLMLFSEALEQQMSNIVQCITQFSRRSGLNINFSKSIVFCSPNTCPRIKRIIGEVASITVTDNMGKYLGIPILQKRVSKNTFGYILDKMNRKLSNWKSKSLTFAWRRVLT